MYNSTNVVQKCKRFLPWTVVKLQTLIFFFKTYLFCLVAFCLGISCLCLYFAFLSIFHHEMHDGKDDCCSERLWCKDLSSVPNVKSKNLLFFYFEGCFLKHSPRHWNWNRLLRTDTFSLPIPILDAWYCIPIPIHAVQICSQYFRCSISQIMKVNLCFY